MCRLDEEQDEEQVHKKTRKTLYGNSRDDLLSKFVEFLNSDEFGKQSFILWDWNNGEGARKHRCDIIYEAREQKEH